MNKPSSPTPPFPTAPTPHVGGRIADAVPPQIGRVRGVVWGILALAIVLALAFPVGVYWQVATSALSAHVCLWPATPRVGAPARLLVILAPGRDSADAQTPQALAQAQWDMLTMEMGVRRAATRGSPASQGVFVVPLWLNMVGPWRALVNLQAPGRPGWRGQLDFTTLAATPGAAAASVPSVSQMLLACQAKGATT